MIGKDYCDAKISTLNVWKNSKTDHPTPPFSNPPIDHACFTTGRCNSYSNTLKALSLTTTSLNIICGIENVNNINKAFARVLRAMKFVLKDENKVKYEDLMWWSEVIKYINKMFKICNYNSTWRCLWQDWSCI